MSEALFKKLVQNIIRATNMADAKSPPKPLAAAFPNALESWRSRVRLGVARRPRLPNLRPRELDSPELRRSTMKDLEKGSWHLAQP